MTGDPQHRQAEPAGAVITVRSRTSVVIGWASLAVLAFFTVDAILRAGLDGLLMVAPFIAWASVVMLAVMVLPKMSASRNRLSVRNILRRYEMPFASVERVRLGAMVRVDALFTGSRPKTVTVWSAPGVGRGPGSERLRADQEKSRSYPAVQLFEAWRSEHSEPEPAPSAVTHWNLGVIAALAVTSTILLIAALL